MGEVLSAHAVYRIGKLMGAGAFFDQLLSNPAANARLIMLHIITISEGG